MNYGNIYRGEFADMYNRSILVIIYKKNYTGGASKMKLGANPLQLSYPGDDNNILHPIFGSELKINILSETDFQYLQLYSSDAREYKVKVFTDGVKTWQGWLLPDLYTEPYVAPPYVVSVSARCGLGELKELQTPATLRNSITFNVTETDTGFIEPLMIIYRGLQQISDITTISENINIMPSDNDEDYTSPLTHTKVYLNEYQGMTWYETIEDILRAFNARIYLCDGVWRIRRVWESEEVIRTYTFDDNGERTVISIDTSQSVASAKLIGKPQNRHHISGSAHLDILPATKKYTIINKFTLRENLLINGDFTTVSDPIIRRIWVSQALTDTEKIYPVRDGWTIVEGQRRFYDDNRHINPDDPTSPIRMPWMYLIRRLIDETYVLFVEDVFLGFNADKENRYLSRIYQEMAVFNNPEEFDDIYQRLELKFKAAIISTKDKDNNFSVRIKYTGYNSEGVFKTYYLIDGKTRHEWTEFEDTIKYTLEITMGEPNNYVDMVYKDIYIVSDVMTLTNARIELMFINSHTESYRSAATMVISDVRTCLISTETDADDYQEFYRYPEDIFLNFTVNDENVKVEKDITLRTGDLPDEPNNTIIWEGGLRFPSNIATKLWHEKGETTELPLETLNSLRYGDNKLIPQFKLSLQILSNDITFENNIVDYQVLPKEYICNTLSYDFRNCIAGGTYIEIGIWNGSDWILEDGTWNDQGIWIDGETWNDEDPTP